MTHRFTRCVHCHTEYSFQASGEGCHNPLNNEHYCPECMQKIIEALKNVPVKYSKRYRAIELSKELIDKFDELKRKSSSIFGNIVRYVNFPYNHIEIYTLNNVEYVLCWDLESHKILLRLDEYDNIKGDFTGNVWGVCKKDGFCNGGNLYTSLKQNCFTARKMDEPASDLFFMDF